ncbi:MAG: 50S ribosomal protein L11 methyltransferase [Planctomycetia bacterium]
MGDDQERRLCWLADLDVDPCVELPGGEELDREAFLGWLWEVAGDTGLLAISEGSVDVAEAAALGLVESPLVLDAAAAPVDRDWVGSRASARVTCGFDSEAGLRAALGRLTGVRGCRTVAVRTEPVADPSAWRAAFGPVAVAGFGTVLPAWEPGVPDGNAADATIFIDPGVGFGTGLHETTQLCLVAIAARRRAGSRLDRVLDFGSGSGILGIAAAVLGAQFVDAIEIDAACHAAIHANAIRNGVTDRLHVAAGLPAEAAGFDLVLANIVAPVLIEQAPALCRQVRRDAAGAIEGGLILGGLRVADVAAVAARYEALLGSGPAVTTGGDWHCLHFG